MEVKEKIWVSTSLGKGRKGYHGCCLDGGANETYINEKRPLIVFRVLLVTMYDVALFLQKKNNSHLPFKIRISLKRKRVGLIHGKVLLFGRFKLGPQSVCWLKFAGPSDIWRGVACKCLFTCKVRKAEAVLCNLNPMEPAYRITLRVVLVEVEVAEPKQLNH